MPALKNKKHEAFAQAVALGMPQVQAYAEFVSSKCSRPTAIAEGSTLAKSPNVSLRISELRKGIAADVDRKFDLTKERWLERLIGIADKAENAEDFSAATNALDKVGKASAWYAPEEVKHSGEVAVVGLEEAIKQVFGRK